jgi:signal transduction histidine kinase
MSISSPLSSLRRRTVEKAVAAERRRIARDLHDGLAQELAFISLQSRRLADRGEAAAIDLAEAAERALSDARAAIERLMDASDQDLHEAVAKTAERMTARSGASLDLDIASAAELAPERREDLLRILREAIWNGIRHGNASSIAVKLSDGTGLRLCVADNGAGFDPHAGVSADSFGLRSMSERARELGGELKVRSARGAGTEVEVVLP